MVFLPEVVLREGAAGGKHCQLNRYLGSSEFKYLRWLAHRSLHLGTMFESLFAFEF